MMARAGNYYSIITMASQVSNNKLKMVARIGSSNKLELCWGKHQTWKKFQLENSELYNVIKITWFMTEDEPKYVFEMLVWFIYCVILF